MFGIRIPDGTKLAVHWKNSNGVTIFRHGSIFKFCWRCLVSLDKFSYSSKFYINIITVCEVMTISFYKEFTRNLEIRNTSFWVLANFWRLGRVRDPKFVTNISNKMLLNAWKCQGYSFWVIKGKPAGVREVKLPPTHSHPTPLPCRIHFFCF